MTPARRLRSTQAWTDLSRAVRATGICALCGAVGVPLEADHIQPLAEAPERGLDPSNIRAVCLPCHGARQRERRR